MKKLLFSLLFASFTIISYAYDFRVDGIAYNINSDGISVTVVHDPDPYDSPRYSNSWHSNSNVNLAIPASVTYNGKTYSVTAIGASAFLEYSYLTSVTIPNSVISIGNGAFYGCSGLTSVSIGNSVTSIGDDSFHGCTSLTSVIIPNSVTLIGSYAFASCTGLITVTIPNSVTSIGEYAFYFCNSLMSVDIPNSVTSIGFQAFNHCDNLSSIVVDIGNMVYDSRNNCNAIIETESNSLIIGCRNTVIPNSVTSIGNGAFYECTGLTSITIPNSVILIDNNAFILCGNLTEVTLDCNAIVSKNYTSSTSNIRNIFENLGGVKNYIIGNSVTSIGNYAFSGSEILTSVTISNSVTSIGENAFSGCRWLTTLTIGNTVTSIGKYAFSGCESLTSVTIPNSVTTIGNNAFSDCWSLRNVLISNSVTEIGESTFFNCGLISVTIPNSVISIGKNAFSWCESLTSVTIGNSVTSIGETAFGHCGSLPSVTIPNSVTTIGDGAFGDCESLTSVTIPHSLTAIGASVFYGCSGLTSVTIPNSVTTIGENAFYGCRGLTSVTIPNSVTDIGASVFYGCSGLNTVNWNAIFCSDCTNSYSSPFYGLTAIRTFNFGDEVERIPAYICYGLTGLTSVTIPNSVSSIGKNAFRDCNGLTNIYSHIENPNNVTLGEKVFYNVDKSNCILTVPAIALGLYRVANQWKEFLNIHPDVFVSSISLNSTQLFIENGKTETLTATVLPSNAYSVLNWTSSNQNVISVNEIGEITANSFGSATITATTTDGSNLSASCHVQVYNQVSSVTLNYTSLIIEKGYSKQITATVYPSNAYNKNLIWASSNPSVAVVDSTGLVTAISVGNTVISATTTDGSNITANCNVEVRAYANAVIINKHETSIYAGGTEQLTAQVLPEDAYNKTVTWRTTNSNVASVSSNGLVTANKVGTAKIIATCNGISDTCVVTVNGITSLTLDKHELTMDLESTEALNVTIEPEEAINKNLTWRSLNTSIATVSNSGLVTSRGIGSTKIIVEATDGSGVSDTCNVTVTPAYDIYPTTTELMHVRGANSSSVVIPFWMSNKTAISGLQFDITLPSGVSFATVDDYPDVWLDASRKARNHTVDVSLISGSKYRVLVSSPTNNTFKGNEGVVLYMRLNIEQAHPIGSYYISTSNVIFVEPDETQHTGYNKSIRIDYKYLLGDADCDARVDIADYTVTALYILNRPTEVFYSDAANVTGDYSINVTDLVGITNISLGIRPQEYRPAPAVYMNNAVTDSAPMLNASIDGDNIVTLGLDNDIPLAGLQLDLQLPQGITLADASLEGRAANYQLGTNLLADGRVRLLVSSFGDKDIEAGNDAIIKLVLNGENVNNDMLYITGAQTASRDLKSYEIDDVSLPIGTTSINDIGVGYEKLNIYGKGNTIVIDSPSKMLIQVVHMNGMVMPVEIKSGHNTIEVGSHGVYIIRVGNNAYKVRL